MSTQRARNLRTNQTNAERRLWQQLRNRQLSGYKFRRQHQIGPYITDFVCLEKDLIVEVDGGQHADQNSYEETRTEFLQRQGFQLLRFWNNDVLSATDAVLETINQALNDKNIKGGGPQ